jgi:hypothetical protein
MRAAREDRFFMSVGSLGEECGQAAEILRAYPETSRNLGCAKEAEGVSDHLLVYLKPNCIRGVVRAILPNKLDSLSIASFRGTNYTTVVNWKMRESAFLVQGGPPKAQNVSP